MAAEFPKDGSVLSPGITGFRAENDSDRSPEFKTGRDRLIGDINDWLKSLAAKRDAGEDIIADVPISLTPRITHTDLGPSGPNTRLRRSNYVNGVSLTGDNISSRLVFQQVKTDKASGITEITEVVGTDPTAAAIYGDEWSTARSNETVASFGVSEIITDSARDPYFAFTFSGTGKLTQSYLREDGVHSATSSPSPQTVEAAKAAFANIVTSIQ